MKMFVVLLLGILVSAGANVLPERMQATQYLKDMPAASRSIEGRITNGYPAEEGSVPYIVGLSFHDGWWCGGSIISNTFVVTAAHCTNNANSGVTIYYGANQRTQAQFNHFVGLSDIIQHQSWPDINGNDISLIRTPQVEFGNLVNRIELPRISDPFNSFANSLAKACGWGLTSDGGSISDNLNCVDVEIIENSVCGQSYNINDDILCIATPNGQSTCSGDSGGPLVRHDDNHLVGVTSFVSGTGCERGAPAGFTRLTSHLEWIRDNSGVVYN